MYNMYKTPRGLPKSRTRDYPGSALQSYGACSGDILVKEGFLGETGEVTVVTLPARRYARANSLVFFAVVWIRAWLQEAISSERLSRFYT